MNSLIGEKLGPYKITEKLGHGGMGEVYKAYQSNLERYVAIKVIRPDRAIEQDFRARFEREVRAAARLQHPHIVHVYQPARYDDLYLMVMEYIAGRSLREYLAALRKDGQLLDPKLILSIAREIGGALDFAHSQGIVHRDVKPANVMVTPDGHAVLTDFGLALLMQERSTTTSVIGTLEYMSPEQISTPKQVGPPTDQYAFGVMLYEMFTGILPHTADNPGALIHQVISEPIEVPSTINTALTPAVDKVLLQALARDPKDRFPSLAVFIESLSEAITLGLNTSGMSFTASIASINFPASERPTSRVSSASRTSRVAGSHSRKTQVAQTRVAKVVQAQRQFERLLWGGIVTSLTVSLIAAGVYFYPRLVATALPSIPQPRGVTLSSDHSKATVLDSNNQPLYEAPVKGEVIALDRVDLDGDKKADELITGVAGSGADSQKIIAWKNDGSRAWEHSFANTVAPYPAYKDKPLKVFNVWSYKLESGVTGVVAVARVPVGSPSQIVLIDPGGAVLREYWTPSHITAVTIADLNNDKMNDILVAAENDDLRDQLGVKSNTPLFTLFMLDPRTMKGEAPPYRGGHGAGVQLWYGAVCPTGVKVESLTTKDVDGDGSLDLWARLSDKRDLYINAKGKVVQATQDAALSKPTFRLYVSNGLDGKCESETPVPVAQVSPTVTNVSVPNVTQATPNVATPTNTQSSQPTAATTSIVQINSETPMATVNPRSTPTVKPNNTSSSASTAIIGETAARTTATSITVVPISTYPFSVPFVFPTLPPAQTSSPMATITSGLGAATTVSGGVASPTFTPRPVATLSTGSTATTAPIAPTQTPAVAPTATTIPSTSTPTFTRTPTPVTPTSTPTFTRTPTPITPTSTMTFTATLTATSGSSNVGHIAFQSNRDGNTEIYVMNADGSAQTRLTNNSVHDDYPTWSPNGTRIAFLSGLNNSWDIYAMNSDGSGLTRLTDSSGEDTMPAWSSDGTRIAFVSDRDGNLEVYVMNSDGTNQTRLTNNSAHEFEPTWSPDGTRIAFVSERDGGNREIYLMNADGTGQTRLTNNSADDRQPDWSPDGTKIVFFTTRNGSPEIYVMNADGSGQTNLTNNSSPDLYPTWSPDGTRIAFVTGRDGSYEIYVMNADGSGQMRLTNNSTTEQSLSWGHE